jgi:hypothetical protein
MTKVRTSVTLDEDLLRAVHVRAARSGIDANAVIEEALRRDLALEMIERLWRPNDLSESEARALAAEAHHATRPREKKKS